MRITFLLIGILLVSNSYAQDPLILKYSKTITAADLEKHLKIIASDSYQGRGTGEKGLEMAADYITKEFKGDKLIGPVKDSKNKFYQEFELQKKSWSKISITAGKESFENFRDVAFINIGEGIMDIDVLFAGFGTYSETYNDYKNIDVKGKLVAFMIGEPKNSQGIYLTTGKNEPSLKVDTTIEGKFKSVQSGITASMMRGAKGFILIEEDSAEASKTSDLFKQYFGQPQISISDEKNMMGDIPFLYISSKEAARLFGIDKQTFDKTIADSLDKGVSPAGKWTQKIKIEAVRKTEMIKTGNTMGFIEGTDKKDEIVVICAHYDHEGIKDGKIYNGADDNGSGTVGLLELSEAFTKAKADKHGPRRSLLFIALTGEEKGLLGSKYYAGHPVLSLPNTVTALNIDMIGRIDKKHEGNGNYLYLIGADYMSTQLDSISKLTAKTYAPELLIDYTYNDKNDPERLYYRSDQISFAEKGVPVIFYTSGEHPDYHKPTDDVDKIDFKSLEKRLQLVFATTWELVNRDERVKVDK